MALSLKHSTTAVGTEAGNGEIGKSEWNDEHAITGTTGRLLGFPVDDAGAAAEVTIGTNLSMTDAGVLSASLSGGSVSTTGTPADNQVAVFTGAAEIEGNANLTYNSGTDTWNMGGAGATFQFSGESVLSDSAGDITLSNISTLDATTEATIEAAIDTLANLTSIQGVTVTLADAGADAIFGWDDTAGAYENLTAAEVRTAAGLVIGTDVQAWDADLDTWATLTPSANAQSLVTAANYAAMRALLDLEVGTDVLAEQAIGIADNNLLEVDGSPNSAEYARFTANGLEGRTEAEFKADFNLEIGTDVQAYDADTLKADVADVLTAGFGVTAYSDGTKSSGTYTPDEADGNIQYVTNGGAHTLAPPTNNCSLVIHYTNNGSAGAITTSGFTLVDGDSLTTTNTHEFLGYITKANDVSHLTWKALQ